MYRDPSEFRERFKAYKEGKSVREIYGLPGYYDGKFSAATKKKIDHYYGKLIANGYDPISAVGILGNAMQESGLDPDSTNSLGYSGLLLNSKAIQQAIINQYGDHSEQSLFRYVSDWTDGSTWIRKGPYAKDTALYSKSYLRKGYKTPEEAAYLFLKRYERAIVVDPKTKKPLRDANGNYIYQDKDKRLKYARDIYNYVTRGQVPLALLAIITNKSLSEPIAVQDATRVATTIPQEKTIPIADPRNATIAEALRAMWAHTAFENMPKVSDMPIWESPSLPALTPVEYDVTPLKTYAGGKLPGYQEGYIQQGKTRPIVHAADRLRRKPGDGVIIGTVKNGLSDALYDIDKSFQSLRNIENFGGTGWDWANVLIGSSFGTEGYLANKTAKEAVKATKAAVKNAAKKAINPTKASVKKNLNPSSLGRYYTEHPEEITPIKDSKELKKAVDFVNLHVAPIYAKQNKVLIGLKPEDINLGYADFGGVDLAAYTGPNNQVVLNKKIINDSKYIDDVLGHEVGGHIVDQNWPITPSQMSEVQLAIPFDQLFIADNKFFPKGAEANAMRRLFLKLISEDNGNIVGSELNKFYKNMPRAQKQRYWSLVGYNDKTNINWDDLSLFDKVMTSIPAAGAFAIPTTHIGIDPNEKLLSYKDGKISINPANRGKFNATKKRTGKTTEELTHSKNPLTRKRAIFALNARKWHHADGKLPGYENGVFPWGEDDTREKTELWADDWASRVTTSRVLKEWNKTGIKPKAESSDEYTNRRVKEETKRTWLSDAADISHGIGEAVIAMDPYTAIPYFGAKIGTDVINGNVGMHTALDATAIAGNWLFNYINPNSLLNQNIRTALYNNKIPYGYNLLDINIPKSYIEGSIEALRGNKIQQLAKPNWFNKSGNILGSTSEASAKPLTEMHQNHRAAAWARYLGLDDTLQGVGYIPSRKGWVTKVKDPYFEDAYKLQIYENWKNGRGLSRGVISDKSAYNTAGGMGYEVNPSTGVVRVFDTWDLLPFKLSNIPILKNFEASQILPGAKPFNFETFISIPR